MKTKIVNLNRSGKSKPKKEILDEARIQLNNIARINNGGCGISAMAIYLWLKKHERLPKDFSFLLLFRSHGREAYNNAIKKVKHNEDVKLFAPSHVVVRVNKRWVDSNDSNFDVDEFAYKLVIPLKKIDTFISVLNGNNWNDSFEREKQMPIIEKTLGIKFPEEIERIVGDF